MKGKTALRIGELSAASGVSRDALRYYEKLGLLPGLCAALVVSGGTSAPALIASGSSNRRRSMDSRCARSAI